MVINMLSLQLDGFRFYRLLVSWIAELSLWLRIKTKYGGKRFFFYIFFLFPLEQGSEGFPLSAHSW